MENIQSPDIVEKLLTADGYNQSGTAREAQAFMNNYSAAQGNNVKLMNLSEEIEDQQMEGAQSWIGQLDQDESQIEGAITTWNNSSKDSNANTALQNALTKLQGQASIDNTSYNQFTQFETGITNGTSQSASDVTQQQSLDMQMFQEGVLTLEQQLGQMLA